MHEWCLPDSSTPISSTAVSSTYVFKSKFIFNLIII